MTEDLVSSCNTATIKTNMKFYDDMGLYQFPSNHINDYRDWDRCSQVISQNLNPVNHGKVHINMPEMQPSQKQTKTKS